MAKNSLTLKAPQYKHFSTVKLLLVEDDPIVQKVHRTFLENCGYTIDIAASGARAWELYISQPYRLLILDGGLPDMSGFELAHRIREHEKNSAKPPIPLLLLSAYPYEQVKHECAAAAINKFAIKPIQQNQLQAMVEQWLGTAAKQPSSFLVIDALNNDFVT